jgi:predicted nucleotidyltransferase
MRTEILREAEGLEGIAALYGMGSYFRGEASYRDIDLVIVVDCARADLLAKGHEIRRSFVNLGERLGVAFDLTILTPREFAEKPLRDMDALELLLTRPGN